MINQTMEMFIDPSRCIGCQACVHACSECDTHRGHAMIHLDYVDRAESPQTVPVVCMHCEEPTCAMVCPADAIKKTADGVVQSANRSRCIGCSNCVLACPFGVPEVIVKQELMMKCDMCYDRTSVGKRPMCATVCPSNAIVFKPREELLEERREVPVNIFQFGEQTVKTKVNIMVPVGVREIELDVAALIATPEPESCSTDPLEMEST
jgi:Fe-S-cluster-containing dehydrogenase component